MRPRIRAHQGLDHQSGDQIGLVPAVGGGGMQQDMARMGRQALARGIAWGIDAAQFDEDRRPVAPPADQQMAAQRHRQARRSIVILAAYPAAGGQRLGQHRPEAAGGQHACPMVKDDRHEPHFAAVCVKPLYTGRI
jgi:hypothetical protein